MIESILIVVAVAIIIHIFREPPREIHHDSRKGSFYEISNRRDN